MNRSMIHARVVLRMLKKNQSLKGQMFILLICSNSYGNTKEKLILGSTHSSEIEEVRKFSKFLLATLLLMNLFTSWNSVPLLTFETLPLHRHKPAQFLGKHTLTVWSISLPSQFLGHFLHVAIQLSNISIKLSLELGIQFTSETLKGCGYLPLSIHFEGFPLKIFCKHQEKPIEAQKFIKNQTCSREENAVFRKVIFFFEQAPSTAATTASLLTISGEQAFGIIATELLHIAVTACSNSSFPYNSKYCYPQCLLICMFDINLLWRGRNLPPKNDFVIHLK